MPDAQPSRKSLKISIDRRLIEDAKAFNIDIPRAADLCSWAPRRLPLWVQRCSPVPQLVTIV